MAGSFRVGWQWIWAGLVVASGCSQERSEGEPAEPASPVVETQASSGSEPSADDGAELEAARREALRADAKALTDAFQAKLKQRLMAAVKEGGPGSAIQVCKVKAPEIAASVPGELGKGEWQIGRTALKVRNPDNAPTTWQRAQLEAFAERIEAEPEVDIASLEWDAVAEHEGAPQWRYMRAIPTGGLCLTCHGDAQSLPPPVKAQLAELYPKDEATGFSAGELRGAFVVTAPFQRVR